jgi:hypothetical protein
MTQDDSQRVLRSISRVSLGRTFEPTIRYKRKAMIVRGRYDLWDWLERMSCPQKSLPSRAPQGLLGSATSPFVICSPSHNTRYICDITCYMCATVAYYRCSRKWRSGETLISKSVLIYKGAGVPGFRSLCCLNSETRSCRAVGQPQIPVFVTGCRSASRHVTPEVPSRMIHNRISGF